MSLRYQGRLRHLRKLENSERAQKAFVFECGCDLNRRMPQLRSA